MYLFRRFVTALCVLVCWHITAPLTLRAQVEGSGPQAHGELRVVLFGPDNRALAGVGARLAASDSVTDPAGVARFQAPEGTHDVRLEIVKELVPEAPVAQGPWVVELPDVPVVEGEETLLIVTLSAAGAVVGFDLQAPEAGGGARSMEREFAAALETKPKGTVSGSVAAMEGGAPIEGARVYVRGAPVEASSDASGRFSIELPEGTYQLSIIHPKFSTQSVPDIKVEGGKAASVRVELSPASVELDDMIVTAPHIQGGVASLIAERRETTAVADVIGAEQMSRSGDSSAASALARVTGLTVVDDKYVIVRGMGERYSSMMVNRLQVPSPEPTRRVVPLDIFPTGILESVVVQKSYSPDMPGEFGGGVVQVRTRGYPEELILNVTAQTGYNTQTHLRDNLTYEGGKYDFLGIDDGTRRLPSSFPEGKKLRLRTRLSPEGEDYSSEELAEFGRSLPVNYQTRKAFTPLDLSLAASVGNKFDLRVADVGFVAAFGYKSDYQAYDEQISRTITLSMGAAKPQDDFVFAQTQRTLSMNGFLDWGVEFSEDQKLKFTTMLLRQTDDETTYRHGFDDNLGRDARRWRLSWVEREVLLQQVAGTHVFESLNDFQADWRYSFARATRLEPDRRDYQYIESTQTGDYIMETGSNGNERLYGDLDDRTHEGALDLTIPLDIWSELTAKLKVGGLVYTRDREAEVRRFQFNVRLPEAERILPPEELFARENVGNGLVFQEVTLPTDFYNAGMDIQAGYGMLELPLSESLEVMGGVRVEHAVIEVGTFDPFARAAPPLSSKLDNTDLLPATTLTWRFIEDFQARAGYSRTLNRPDLRELSPNRFFDVEANVTMQGTTALERSLIDNYDLRLEWYYTTDEVFSIGGFYKDFDRPIETTILPTDSETVLSWQNTKRASLVGLEVEGRKRFDFITSALDSLYLAGNFSWIDSEVEIGLTRGGTYRRPLQSQSPWVVNVQLGWDDTSDGGTGTAANLLFNMAGRRIRAVGDPDDGVPDQYEEPVARLDLVLSQDLPHGFKLGARAQNLLNPTIVWKQGDVEVRRYKKGVDLSVAVSWSY